MPLPRDRNGEITGLSENHVGVRLSRIRQDLARILEEGKEP